MKNNILPLAAMENLLKIKANAPRVSNSAKEELRNILEDYAEKIGEMAVKLAAHSKRKTVTGEDIRLAAKS
ncbi:MAG: NFYB/HAP3 family transcription factor subunit [Candidatus Nanoarchaeia archaeon]|nr:NFYB/HAP3 family transcription factor subunit [Candidatus Nanoarchaeia archaeon]